MQRSVIQLAGRTLVVSLPSAWCKENGVKKGGKLELTTQGTACIINSPELRSAGIELDQPDSSAIWYYLQSAYDLGIDEVRIVNPNKNAAKQIRDATMALPGWELVKQSEKRMILRDISTPRIDELPELLGRSVHIMHDFAKSCHDASQNPHDLRECAERSDEPLNRITHLCSRMLMRSTMTSRQIANHLTFLAGLEHTGDSIRDCARTASKLSVSSARDLFKTVERAAELFSRLYFSRNPEHLAKIIACRQSLLTIREKTGASLAAANACKHLAEIGALLLVSHAPNSDANSLHS